MFHGSPNCPECGSRFLVTAIRMTGGHVPPPDLTVYRCYRCFAKFTDEDVAGSDGEDGSVGDAGSAGYSTAGGDDANPNAKRPIEVIDVDIAVSSTGEKRAVDRFAVTLSNDGTGSVRVARATLSFPDDEESVAPLDSVVLAPDETATVAISRDWFHPGQDAVTVRLVGDGDVVGSVRITDLS